VRTCGQLPPLLLRGHEQYVKYVACSLDGTMIASASGDTTIRLWDTSALPERRARAVK
jgi:WD40 repeat protein